MHNVNKLDFLESIKVPYMQPSVKISTSLLPPVTVVEHFPFVYLTALEYRNRNAHKRLDLHSAPTSASTHSVQLSDLVDEVEVSFRQNGRSSGIMVTIHTDEVKHLPETSQWLHDTICSHPEIAAVRRKLKNPWSATVSQAWHVAEGDMARAPAITPTPSMAVVSSTRTEPRISRGFAADTEQLAALKKWFVDNWSVVFLSSYAKLGELVNKVTDAQDSLNNRAHNMPPAQVGARHMHLKKCQRELESFEGSMVEVPTHDTDISFRFEVKGNT